MSFTAFDNPRSLSSLFSTKYLYSSKVAIMHCIRLYKTLYLSPLTICTMPCLSFWNLASSITFSSTDALLLSKSHTYSSKNFKSILAFSSFVQSSLIAFRSWSFIFYDFDCSISSSKQSLGSVFWTCQVFLIVLDSKIWEKSVVIQLATISFIAFQVVLDTF